MRLFSVEFKVQITVIIIIMIKLPSKKKPNYANTLSMQEWNKLK